jgi:broad specificity phosphatase PhoE
MPYLIIFKRLKSINMMRVFHALFIIFLLTSCGTTTYYISRHAERAGGMGNDPQLTPEGEKQALDLKDYLKDKNIKGVYSTNFNRTKATARPTSEHFTLPVNIYNPQQANGMLDSLKANNKNNILIVGHSNTVDDIVNRLMGASTMTDLPETEYGSLFIVRKKGSNYSFEKIKVPQTTQR